MTPLYTTISLASLLLSSCFTLLQTDLKRLIAYSSIAHMALLYPAALTSSLTGTLGAILLLLSHGLSSTALFLLIGCLYNRTHHRLIRYHTSLLYQLPLFTLLISLAFLANLSLPSTLNFIAELLILQSCLHHGLDAALLLSLTMLLAGAYSLVPLTRLSFGPSLTYGYAHPSDLSLAELLPAMSTLLLNLAFGLYPLALTRPLLPTALAFSAISLS